MAITIPTEIAATHGFNTEITLVELAVILGVDAPATTEPETAPVDAEWEAVRAERPHATDEEIDRIVRMRRFRAQYKAEDARGLAAAAALKDGQVVFTTGGYFIIEGRSERVTWGEFANGDVAQTEELITVSKCRKDGSRLKSHQFETVRAAFFGCTLK